MNKFHRREEETLKLRREEATSRLVGGGGTSHGNSMLSSIPSKVMAPEIKSKPVNLNTEMRNTKTQEETKRLDMVNKALNFAREICYEKDREIKRSLLRKTVKNSATPVVERMNLLERH